MLTELLQRAGTAYKNHFLEREAAEPPRRRVESVITRKAMWLNHLKYFRIALAISTSTACLMNAKSVICMGSTGNSFDECFLE